MPRRQTGTSKAKKSEPEEAQMCQHTLKSGQHMGNQCTHYAVKGGKFCSAHSGRRSTRKRTGDPFQLNKLKDPKMIMTARAKGDNNLNPCGTARTKKQQATHKRKLQAAREKRNEEKEYRLAYQTSMQ